MKRLILSLTLALTLGATHALTVDGDKVVLSEQERKDLPLCAEQGGCHIVSRAMLENYVAALMQNYMATLQASYEQAVAEESKRICKNPI